MYQFMVATRSDGGTNNVRHGNSAWIVPGGTDGGNIPMTMSLTSGTNKWASRAVVALQLAAWSAVGIVLLEKGVASLQKNTNHDRYNISGEVPRTESTSAAMFNDNNKVLAETSAGRVRNLLPHDVQPDSGLFSVVPLIADDPAMNNNYNDPAEAKRIAITDRPRESVDDSSSSSTRIDQRPGRLDKNDDRSVMILTPLINDPVESTKFDGENSSSPPMQESSRRGRKRSRFAKVGSGGAAAAVAMIAVGAVMLVLGPAVIALRALDERRQERRFLKLSGEEDLPPSYEQATGNCDQAPTYSSLNLDAILSDGAESPAARSSNNSTCVPLEA